MSDRDDAILDILENLGHDNPPPEERWFLEDDFDPPFLRRDLRAAARKELIELDEESFNGFSYVRFRLTDRGRAMLKNALLQVLDKEAP